MIPGKVIWLGQQKYSDTWELQKQLVTKVREGEEPDTLLLVEHDPVLTLGRSSKKEHILVSKESLAEEGIDLFEVERGGGGDVTYHGPGPVGGLSYLGFEPTWP